MLVLAGLVLGSLTFYVKALNASVAQSRTNLTHAALSQAKEALIAWSAEYEYISATDNARLRSGGHLPCPDRDNDGDSEGSNCAGGSTIIGRLPWKTLKTPILRDETGEPLWYAVSPNFRNNRTLPVNSDTQGQLSVSGNVKRDHVIAVVFAPGRALDGQSRDTEESKNYWANYLETVDIDRMLVEMRTADDQSNDSIFFITAEDLFPAVERRVEQGIRESLKPLMEYYKSAWHANTGRSMFPFPAPFNPIADDRELCGDPALTQGMLPLSDCGMEWDFGSIQITGGTGTCEAVYERDAETDRAFPLPEGAVTAIQCKVRTVFDEDDIDDEESIRVDIKIESRLAGGALTLAMPLEKRFITYTGAQPISSSVDVKSTPTTDGSGKTRDIKVRFKAQYRIHIDDDDDDDDDEKVVMSTTVTMPIFGANAQYERDMRDSEEWAKLNPSWFFSNNWHRVTYYATVPHRLPCDGSNCPPVGEPLNVVGGDEAGMHEVLFILTGSGVDGAPRPSNAPQSYLEQYAINQAFMIGTRRFEQLPMSRTFNDRIIPVSSAP